MKTSDLTGAALDWAVAKCEKFDAYIDYSHHPSKQWGVFVDFSDDHAGIRYTPSKHWGFAGPIIEREKITLEWTGEDWCAYIRHDEAEFGPTPLIAAMRCYVASQLGDEVDVPPELT